jgi:uroporphyrinogen-III synthase
VVTRPAGQAETLIGLLVGEGAEVLHFPTIEVRPLYADTAPALRRLAAYDVVIFVSRNAVREAASQIAPDGSWPSGPQLAAVGRATAAALSRSGRPADLVPERDYSSEGLLELPQLQQVEGKRILIVRGEGGRELLAETLDARGAQVEYAEVYRRSRPDLDPEPLRRRLADRELDLIIVTSREGLENLFAMMDKPFDEAVRSVPLAVISQAVARAARDLGMTGDLMVAPEASDRGLLRAIQAWNAKRGDPEGR